MTVYDGDENVLYWHETVYDESTGEDDWISITSYDRDGTETGHAEHIRDEQGNSCSSYRSDGQYTNSFTYYEGIGTVSQSTTEAEYDNAGKVLRSTSYDENGEVSGYYEYEYNDAGKTAQCISYSKSGEISGMTTFEYNDEGRLSCTKHYTGGGELIRCERTEYDSAGHASVSESYSSDEQLESRTEREYNDDGRLCQATRYSGYPFSISDYTTYEYNSSGKVVLENEYDDLYGDEFLVISRIVYTYDQDDELLCVEYYDIDYEFEYDTCYETHNGIVLNARYVNPTYVDPPEEILKGKIEYTW